jgi:hypothetical protein
MMRFSSLAPPAALLLVAPLLFAQDVQPVQPVNQSVAQPATQAVPKNIEQAETVFSPEEKLQYFALEHRSPDQIEPQDAELLSKRKRDILAEAEFFGYDTSAAGWAYEQSVCTQMPDYILLRYTNATPAGPDSIFTVLVPRHGGRIRIVPVLNHGATRFKPAPTDPRNFELFSQVIPADVAKQNSGPEGKWLALTVCYAEMTGARPQVPNEPSLDLRMIKAPPPTLRISVSAKEHEVRFVEPYSQTDYKLWDITYNEAGRIISANDDLHSYGEVVVKQVPEPTPKQIPEPPSPPIKQIPDSQQVTPVPQENQPQPQPQPQSR